MVKKKLLSLLMTAAGAGLFVVSPVAAQESEETNPNAYDKSFIDRPDHKKPTNPFAAKAADFPKHSYRRMLLNSPFASSSVGLGVNTSNQMYNQNAYTYMNPDSFKANDATPEEVNRYIDQVYKPSLNSSGNQGYETNKGFDQPNPFNGSRSTLTEDNPFGNTFDNGPNSPFMQTGPVRKKQYYGQKDDDFQPKSSAESPPPSSTAGSPRESELDQSNF